MSNALWFKDWFNSPYYHILYKKRDDKEARGFMDALCKNLQLNPNHKVWDLACGKGRHSIYLNSKGFNVIGTDLSDNNITEALKSSNETLEFYKHDMRTPFRMNYFSHVFNLFTSIGYFENERDNLKVFKNVYQCLKKDGLFVIDFFNSENVVACMLPENKISTDGIDFSIQKKVENKRIVKRIEFSDKGENYVFEEKVSLLTRKDLTDMAIATNFSALATYGDYSLNSFDEKKSERLILIFKK